MIPIPPNLPLGAQWLQGCPRVDGFLPGGAQPVQEVIWYHSPDGLRVVRWSYAVITPAHIGTGTNTNAAIRQWVQQQVGYPTDDAGHIIGNNLGGLGTVDWNIFPQSSNLNRGAYSHYIEDLNRIATQHGPTRIWYQFLFNDPNKLTRATSFRYFAILSDGTIINNELVNPI
jgi:hypothetical protein